ncbi:hypothetical protein EBB79_24615 (plasmid) [Parasedimentitalea marina]|uniref:Uncharacterized protein n=1 Tax=Parasedimentitalea marina TaxID=2483033 RepID=A0A3T0NAI8_9RHOB|nr:hypothetical protein [Parasedimentitalea marina]AZV81064.1 hypothetical protein EBB79_24615 [Parasedimentitalea marina]
MVATRIPGEDVKSMVRQGTRKRMCFGFCHDKKNDPLLMIEPGKKPEALSVPLKKAGGEPPMTWGTFVVRSDQMEMICEKVSAKVTGQLKKFLRKNQPKVNVLFFDKGGNLLDSLKPEGSDAVVSDDKVADLAPPEGSGAQDLVQRLKDIRPRIALAPGPLEIKLKRALAKSVQQVNDGRLQEAETLVSMIEMTLAKIGQTVESEELTQVKAQVSRDKMSMDAGVKRAQALRANVERSPGAARSKLDRAVHEAAKLLKSRDLEGANKVMDKIEKALMTLG